MVSSCCKIAAIIVVVFAALIGYLINNIQQIMAYDKEISFNDKCRLLKVPTPVEDLSALGDGHCAFAGGGDLWNTFQHGSKSAAQGAIWLVNATDGSVRQLEISGANAPRKLILHGIHYSQKSGQLYAVNHDEEVGEGVEVFEVIGTGSAIRLHHVVSIRSPLFNNFALNDVVEGASKGEVYVTEWQPYAYPSGGLKTTQHIPFIVKFQRLLVFPLFLLKIPTTRVFRCTVGDLPHCSVASEQRFVGANGIAVSSDRETVYVNDAVSGRVHIMQRSPSGSLKPVSSVKPKHILDNIEVDAEGYLAGGSVPLPYTSHGVCDEAKQLSATKVVSGHTVGCGRSPGGLMLFSADGAEVKAEINSDGSLMSDISAALKVGTKVLMGSYHSPGILLCDA